MSTTATDTQEKPVGTPQDQADEIERVFHRQGARAIRLRSSTAAERVAKIKRLKQALLAQTEAVYAACAADFGKPRAEVELTEILPVVMEAKAASRHLRRWMKPRKVAPTLAMLGTRAQVRAEPRGVTLIISPWNYPINLSFAPLISALAAGNTAILKPSEMTPHCAQLMQKIVDEVFEADDVAVFQGAVETTQNLLAQPFHHIFFTGSPAVGKIVMAAASKNLSSVTLELGGKSPAIVDQSADIKKAAASVAWGKFANNGQTCIAPDLTYVHADVEAEFVAGVKDALANMYGALTDLQSNADYCRIVNERHYQRLTGLLEDAQSSGARLLLGGQHDKSVNFLAPTLLDRVPADARIMEEEIFGPLLPIVAFRDAEEVIAAVNSRPKPLALYVYGRDNNFIERIIANTSAGGTCVNAAMLHFLHANLPFGGVNNSGIGQSHGRYGFQAFSHERAVLRDRFSAAPWFRPPYNAVTRALIRWTRKYLV